MESGKPRPIPFKASGSLSATAAIWLAAMMYYSLKGFGIILLMGENDEFVDLAFLVVGISPVFVYLLAAVI